MNHQQSQFQVRRLKQLKNLSILAPLSTQQLKALLISHVAMSSLVQLYKTQTIRRVSQESPISTKLYNTCILPIFCMALSVGQLPREMHKRLMLSINGVCERCQESNGTINSIPYFTQATLRNHNTIQCNAQNHDVRWTIKQLQLLAIVQ